MSGSDNRGLMKDTVMVRLPVNRFQQYYVYALAYPQGYCHNGDDLSDVVFYIGKGTDNRIDSHEMEAGNRNSTCYCKKCKVIRKIWADGKQVQKYKLLEGLKESEAFAFERKCIQDFYAGPYLINKRDNPIHYEQERNKARARISHSTEAVLDQMVTSQEACRDNPYYEQDKQERNKAQARISHRLDKAAPDQIYLTSQEACKVLGFKDATLLNYYAKTGRIRKYRKGIRNVVFSRGDVERLKQQLGKGYL